MSNNSGVVLVSGGAGYIGSHTVMALTGQGIPCVVVDDLSTGYREFVPGDVALCVGDIGDSDFIAYVCTKHSVSAVIHFAGSIVQPESFDIPLAYYDNNTCKSHQFIKTIIEAGVGTFIFSSTAAVYGTAGKEAIGEDAPTVPVSPYGRSKLATEWMIEDAAVVSGLRYAILRYFNVAGADSLGRSGQSSVKPTHLIKLACETATGKRSKITIFGTDYDTPDGSCIRDYIHVSDLASTHVRTLEYLLGGGENTVFNCGYGRGFSVLEVTNAFAKITGTPLACELGGRRMGDTDSLIADPAKMKQTLGWRPEHDDLLEIIESALEWERKIT